MASAAPTVGDERIGELDIIRGFALFGVLWMNLFEHQGLVIPPEALEGLTTAPVDKWVGFLSSWLMIGKAQALFSLLFGFGFAMLTERADARGANGTLIYLRRVTILLAVGIAHLLLFWIGDILHAYALLGFALLLTRKWPGWALLALGVPLATLPVVGMGLWDLATLAPGQVPPRDVAQQAGLAIRWELFRGSDFPAYVAELTRASWAELYSQSIGPTFLGWIFGRFLIGSWIHRQGWLQDASRYAAGFRKWAAILIGIGLAMALIGPLLRMLEVKPGPDWRWFFRVNGMTSMLVLALGYGAGIVVLCQLGAWRRRLAGLGLVGRMALTNYLMQTLVYLFVLYGFGLGLLPYAGPTFCLALALAAFAAQIAFSRWWLARYRFGPAEWLWRSGTYGTWQRMRRAHPAGGIAASEA